MKKTVDDFVCVKNNLEGIYDEYLDKLKNSEVIHVRKATINEKDVLKKGESLNMNETYYID